MSDNRNQDDGSGVKHALNKAGDMVGGMVGLASASTAGSHDSTAFVTNACISDLYEVDAAAIAMRRSRSDAVREFAKMMFEHHTTAMHQMQSALSSSEVRSSLPDLAAPETMDDRRQGLLKHLDEAPDDAFDKAYLDQQRMAHQEAVALHRGYAESGDNPQLRSLAAGGLPMIERHLAQVQRVAQH